LNSLKSVFTLLLDEDVLDLDNSGVALLEGEVSELVTLGSTSLDDTTFYLGLFASSFSTRDL
jgi:hypothetical protein